MNIFQVYYFMLLYPPIPYFQGIATATPSNRVGHHWYTLFTS